ncbi:MAG TPA: sugar ABC transporter substrate-binding protein [Chloroflexota bacterium]|nr:sugar ABC transporter substrate-binding protein [Chloroflexota bacterium]
MTRTGSVGPSRRGFLTGVLGLTVVSALAACSQAAPSPTAAPAPATAKPAATTAAASAPAVPPTTAAAASPAAALATAAAAPTTAPAAKATVSAAPATLSIIGLDGHPSWIATKEMIKKYHDVAPQVTIKTAEFALPQINDKVNLDFQAKKGEYDIVWMNSAQTEGYWVEAKIVIPLDQMITKDYDIEDFLPLARNIATLKSQLFGISIMIEQRMLSYRKDLFDAAGLKVPTNVDEMTAAAQKLTNKSKNQYGFSQRTAASISAAYDWVGWLYGYGGVLIDQNNVPQLNTPEAKAALDAFLAINKFTSPASNRGYGDVVKELQTGVAAMANDVTIILPLLEDPTQSKFAGKFGYDVAPAGPKGPRPETSAHILSIDSLSKQRDPAWQFLSWMTSKANNEPWCFAGGAAFRQSMYEDKAIIDKFPVYPLFEKILNQGNPDYIPRIKPGFQLLDKLSQNINAAITGVKMSQQALSDSNAAMTDILKQAGFLK